MNKNCVKIFLFIIILLFAMTMVNASDVNNSISQLQSHSTQSDNLNEKYLEKNDSSDKLSASSTINFNSVSYSTYVTDGELNSLVSDGDTIDITGKLDNKRFSLFINKSVNIISSNNESYICLYNNTVEDYGKAITGAISFGSGASGSNITGLNLSNTRIIFDNVSNININNISLVSDKLNGHGDSGFFIINGESNNINITNSYFNIANYETNMFLFNDTDNCVFENNTIITDNSGTVINITGNYPDSDTTYRNHNFTINNNFINATNNITNAYAISMEGLNHILTNNTVFYYGVCLSKENSYNLENVTLLNNRLLGDVILNETSKLIRNNSIHNLTIGNTTIYDNVFNYTTISLDNVTFERNIVNKTVFVNADDVLINNNTISSMEDYAIIVTGTPFNVSVTNNFLASGISNGSADKAINSSFPIFKTVMLKHNDIFILEWIIMKNSWYIL